MLQHLIKHFLTACSFMTILPIPQDAIHKDERFYDSVKMFPLVGVMLGMFTLLVASLLNACFPVTISAIGIVFFMTFISLFFHLDGLADTADGFLSSRPRERMLEIMKDSRIGTMGAVVLIFYFLLKVQALGWVMHHREPYLWNALFLAPVLGRCSLVLGMFKMTYAREEGMGKGFWRADGPMMRNTFLFLVGLAFICLGFLGILFILGYLVLLILWRKICLNKIGGGTGDTLGALCELAELYTILFFCLR